MSIHDIMKRGDTSQLEQMLKTNPKLISEKHGHLDETLLHGAVNLNNTQVARVLLQNGARCDVGDSVSDTPLHRAAMDGKEDMLQELVNSCTQKQIKIDNVRNCARETVLHVACHQQQKDCVKVLLNAGVGVNIQDTRGFTPLHYAASAFNLEVVQMLLGAGANITVEANSVAHEKAKTGRGPIHYAMACHKPKNVTTMMDQMPDDLHRATIADYLHFGLDIGALECKTCDMVGIIVRSTVKRMKNCDILRPVVGAQLGKNNVKLSELPEQLQKLVM